MFKDLDVIDDNMYILEGIRSDVKDPALKDLADSYVKEMSDAVFDLADRSAVMLERIRQAAEKIEGEDEAEVNKLLRGY